jgi:hypothetical protein
MLDSFYIMAELTHEVILEVDGPGLHTDTVDTVAALRLGAEYFELLRKIAAETGATLTFVGIRAVDKCHQWIANANDAYAAKDANKKASAYLRGEQIPTRSVKSNVTRTRQAIQLLPTGAVVFARMGEERFDISGGSTTEETASLAELSLRARLIAVGGKRPTAKFEASAEGSRQFTIELSEGVAQQLGQFLYRDLDIHVRVRRDAHGQIAGGRLLSFAAVQGSVSVDELRAWFKDAGKGWNEVDDLEAELGRD